MTGDPAAPSRDGRRRAILAIDTATSRVVVALGSPDGDAIGMSYWAAGQRHGEQLLPSIGRLLGENNIRRSRLVAIVVGTGPGAFTGLRVGLSTAKGLAHGLGIPIVGIATTDALRAAAAFVLGLPAERLVVLQPAGPSDRVMTTHGEPPRRLPGGTEPDLRDGDVLVAVDLPDRAPADAIARGEAAHERLADELLRLGAARLAAGDVDDLAGLVPEYVTLPRGVTTAPAGEVAWSRAPR
jgi:tRNA threonylcarbamoyl adenosine modification protein YeaZ